MSTSSEHGFAIEKSIRQNTNDTIDNDAATTVVQSTAARCKEDFNEYDEPNVIEKVYKDDAIIVEFPGPLRDEAGSHLHYVDFISTRYRGTRQVCYV
jgi:hypothetical protein